jgi:hypothetical protein
MFPGSRVVLDIFDDQSVQWAAILRPEPNMVRLLAIAAAAKLCKVC